MADLLFDICSAEDHDVTGRVAALTWSIWQNRNAVVWCNPQLTPIQVGYNAFRVWQSWVDAQQIRSRV
ncbi:hypothetical protein TSUD_144280 [Trifolium subterraneum]|nr:hypothetical protein TSUD_144280 [Trifolium subterraneum]